MCMASRQFRRFPVLLCIVLVFVLIGVPTRPSNFFLEAVVVRCFFSGTLGSTSGAYSLGLIFGHGSFCSLVSLAVSALSFLCYYYAFTLSSSFFTTCSDVIAHALRVFVLCPRVASSFRLLAITVSMNVLTPFVWGSPRFNEGSRGVAFCGSYLRFLYCAVSRFVLR